jgi:hypothetical protein
LFDACHFTGGTNKPGQHQNYVPDTGADIQYALA